MSPAARAPRDPDLATYSVSGVDLDTGEWGMAIASRFLAVGSLTRFAELGVGVVAVQANASVENGLRAMSLLRAGVPSQRVLDEVLDGDFNLARRQMSVIDRDGAIATFTGENCNDWAGSHIGNNCVAIGNTLSGRHVVTTMVEAFEAHRGTLPQRLVAALSAGEEVGGDRRGKQSAALLVVRPGADRPLNVFSNRTVDIRVDDHARPCAELRRLHLIYDLLYDRPGPAELVEPTEEVTTGLQSSLRTLGQLQVAGDGRFDDVTRRAMADVAERLGLSQAVDVGASRLDRRFLQLLEVTTVDRLLE